jgi:holo-[acyl-carrier protein] synthase
MAQDMKIGIDLVENDRIRGVLERFGDRFLDRVFGEAERSLCMARKDRVGCLAARFSAKEALLKAFGVGMRGGVRWRDIQVLKDDRGAPYYELSGKALELLRNRRAEVSLSHGRDYSVAVAFVYGGKDGDAKLPLSSPKKGDIERETRSQR